MTSKRYTVPEMALLILVPAVTIANTYALFVHVSWVSAGSMVAFGAAYVLSILTGARHRRRAETPVLSPASGRVDHSVRLEDDDV